MEEEKKKPLTVKERIEEKKVPSSYRESLDSTPSKTAANCECRRKGNLIQNETIKTHLSSTRTT